MTTTQTFEQALDNFVALLQQADDQRMVREFPTLCVNGRGSLFTTEIGSKNIRIVRSSVQGESRSVHCFVQIATGDILKSASWKQPAKGARGNIYHANPMAGMDAYGTKYLR
jgi:hypothetical protein